MTVTITLPNGKEMPGAPNPGEATKLEIIQMAIQKGLMTEEEAGGFVPEPWKKNTAPGAGVNPIAGNIEQLLSGATLGHSDELQALVAAGYTAMDPSGSPHMPGTSFMDRYRQARDELRNRRNQFIEQAGAAAYVPEIAGGLITGGTGLAKFGTTMPRLLATGGIEGGIAGAGAADADDYLSPETATMAGLGALAGAAIPATAGVAGRMIEKSGVVDAVKSQFPNIRGVPDQYQKQIEGADVPDPSDAALNEDMAQYLVKEGRAVKDPLWPKAKSLGIKPALKNSISQLSPADKNRGLQMLSKIKKFQATGGASQGRASDIVGDTIDRKITFVKDINSKQRIQLNNFAKNQLRGKSIDINDQLSSFGSALEELGVDIVTKKKGVDVVFKGADIGPNDKGPLRDVIEYIYEKQRGGPLDAYDAHRLKRKIDTNIPWDAINRMSEPGQRVLEKLRRDVNKAIQDTNPGYKKINKDLQTTTRGLKEFMEAVKIKVDLREEEAITALGQESRKLFSNYSSRPMLIKGIRKLEEAAIANGYETADSIRDQARLFTQLEELFGPSATTSLRAETGKALEDAMRSTGDQRDLLARGVDLGRKILTEADVNQQLKIIEQMLLRQ